MLLQDETTLLHRLAWHPNLEFASSTDSPLGRNRREKRPKKENKRTTIPGTIRSAWKETFCFSAVDSSSHPHCYLVRGAIPTVTTIVAIRLVRRHSILVNAGGWLPSHTHVLSAAAGFVGRIVDPHRPRKSASESQGRMLYFLFDVDSLPSRPVQLPTQRRQRDQGPSHCQSCLVG